MQRLFYVDIAIVESVENNEADSISIHDILSRIFNVIHGINCNHDEKVALDILTFENDIHEVNSVIRLFHHNREFLQELVDTDLSKHWIIRDYAMLYGPARTKHTDNYVINRRRRVYKKESRLREQSLEHCKTLTHFKLKSKSNFHPFIFSIEQDITQKPVNVLTPTNYGLSTADNKFSVPRF